MEAGLPIAKVKTPAIAGNTLTSVFKKAIDDRKKQESVNEYGESEHGSKAIVMM
jgi:hypothetical protein